jgi:hypothetical protein
MQPLIAATLVAALLSLFAVPASAGEHVTSGEPTSFERLALSFEGLGVVNNRYGITGEYVLRPRDSITAMPWLATGHSSGPIDPVSFGEVQTTYDVDFDGLGLDLQYRRYFGPWVGARGLFLAPGVDVSHFNVRGTSCDATHGACEGSTRQRFTYLGPTADIGGQAIFGPGIVAGVSLGVRYRAVLDGHVSEEQLPWAWKLPHGPGFGVRARLWLGFAFL